MQIKQSLRRAALGTVLGTMLLAAMCTLTACGNDDDKNEPRTETKTDEVTLVGTWRWAYDETEFNQLVLFADGTGLGQEWVIDNGREQCKDEWEISYVYDKKNSRLTIVEMVDGDIRNYEVVSHNARQLVLRQRGQVETYVRVK